MSASRLSEAEISMLWGLSLQSGLLGRVEEAELSRHLGIPIEQAHSILDTLIEIGAYDPVTRRMDPSKLPAMRWSEPLTYEELIAQVQKWCGNPQLN